MPPTHNSPSSAPAVTIERSAAVSAKGPRLQRLRAALFLLEAIADQKNVQAYAAIETEGDAFVATATSSASNAYTEENKNYGPSGAFTFVTDAVLNSIVIFVDQWVNWRRTATLRFGLYTTVAIGKEKNTGRVKDLGLTLPAGPILELLRARDYTDPNLLPCVSALILHEYRAQYERSLHRGHLSSLQNWSHADWCEFLALITWLFTDADEAGALQKLVDAVKKCRFYSEQHEGKEDLLCSALLDLFDRKQLAHDYGERFVHASEVRLLFKQVESGEIRRTDPTWQIMDTMPPPTDLRNVGEKLASACPTLSANSLQRYQRRTAAGLAELDAHAQDKNVRAMRFQVYDVCESALAALAAQAPVLTEIQLAAELDNLTSLALARVHERATEYGYAYKSETFVRGLILELFDSCFLAFSTGSRPGFERKDP